jgi:hypothetical protein
LLLSYSAGVGAGTILGGYLTKSKAPYWSPFVGSFAGAALGYVVGSILFEVGYPKEVSGALTIVLPILGSVAASGVGHYLRVQSKRQRDLGEFGMSLGWGF